VIAIDFKDLRTIREANIWASGYSDAMSDIRPQLDEAETMCRDLAAQLVNVRRDLANAEAGHWERVGNTHRQAAESAARGIEIRKARAAHAARFRTEEAA
jgi:hypothetical protein